MYRISVTLCLLGVLAAALAADSPDCGTQYKDMVTCMGEIKESDLVKTIMDKKKQVFKDTCAPDYPKSCMTDWDNMMTCCKELSDKAKNDGDAKAMMEKAVGDINKCFDTQPQNPFSDLEEIFMPKLLKAMMMGKPMGNSSSSGSAESGEDNEDDFLPTPSPDMKFRPECLPKPKQFHCLKSEMIKAYTSDAVFKKAVQSVMAKKDECDFKVKTACDLSTPQLTKCFWDAHKEFFKSMFTKMADCMKSKSSGGGGSSGGSSGGTSNHKKD